MQIKISIFISPSLGCVSWVKRREEWKHFHFSFSVFGLASVARDFLCLFFSLFRLASLWQSVGSSLVACERAKQVKSVNKGALFIVYFLRQFFFFSRCNARNLFMEMRWWRKRKAKLFQNDLSSLCGGKAVATLKQFLRARKQQQLGLICQLCRRRERRECFNTRHFAAHAGPIKSKSRKYKFCPQITLSLSRSLTPRGILKHSK